LRAATIAFATEGYTHASIRGIAAASGCNASLVLRYFGSKEGLFEAVLNTVLSIDRLTSAGREAFGAHVARFLTEPAPYGATATTILAIADPGARAITVRLLEKRIIGELAKWLGPGEARMRASLITALCMGYSVYRHFLPLAALNQGRGKTAEKWLAAQLQALVDGPPP
jgi:AcrR family transcriptional regulator